MVHRQEKYSVSTPPISRPIVSARDADEA